MVLTATQAQVHRAAPVSVQRHRSTFRPQPCTTLLQHSHTPPLRQKMRQQLVCRAASQQEQRESESLLGFDRNDTSIIDVTPEGHVDAEVVEAAQQPSQTPAWWKFGERIAKGAAVFALAMALVNHGDTTGPRFPQACCYCSLFVSTLRPCMRHCSGADRSIIFHRRLRLSAAAHGQPAAAAASAVQVSVQHAAAQAVSAAAAAWVAAAACPAAMALLVVSFFTVTCDYAPDGPVTSVAALVATGVVNSSFPNLGVGGMSHEADGSAGLDACARIAVLLP